MAFSGFKPYYSNKEHNLVYVTYWFPPEEWTYVKLLNNNQQKNKIKIENHLFELRDRTLGIPQRSVVNLFLFMLYVNDLPNFISKGRATNDNIRGKITDALVETINTV